MLVGVMPQSRLSNDFLSEPTTRLLPLLPHLPIRRVPPVLVVGERGPGLGPGLGGRVELEDEEEVVAIVW
jgi:hypothetical protein